MAERLLQMNGVLAKTRAAMQQEGKQKVAGSNPAPTTKGGDSK